MDNLELTQLIEMLTDKETAKKLSEGITQAFKYGSLHPNAEHLQQYYPDVLEFVHLLGNIK